MYATNNINTSSSTKCNRKEKKKPWFKHILTCLLTINEYEVIIDEQLQQDKINNLPSKPMVNIVIHKGKPKTDLVEFLYGAVFILVKNTWIQAIKKGSFITCKGVSPELINNHQLPGIYTTKDHLQQEYQGIQ